MVGLLDSLKEAFSNVLQLKNTTTATSEFSADIRSTHEITIPRREIPVRQNIKLYYPEGGTKDSEVTRSQSSASVSSGRHERRLSISYLRIDEVKLLDGGELIAEPARTQISFSSINKSLVSFATKIKNQVAEPVLEDGISRTDLQMLSSDSGASVDQPFGYIDLDLPTEIKDDLINYILECNFEFKGAVKGTGSLVSRNYMIVFRNTGEFGEINSAPLVAQIFKPKKISRKPPERFVFTVALLKLLSQKEVVCSHIAVMNNFIARPSYSIILSSFGLVTLRMWLEGRSNRTRDDAKGINIADPTRSRYVHKQCSFMIQSIFGISAALCELHKYKVLHDSLTPDHVFISILKGRWTAVLTLDNIDYSPQRRGLSQYVQKQSDFWMEMDLENYPVMYRYLAPERITSKIKENGIAFNKEFTDASDVYSFGHLMYFALTSEDPMLLYETTKGQLAPDFEDPTLLYETKNRQLSSAVLRQWILEGWPWKPVPNNAKDLFKNTLHLERINGIVDLIDACNKSPSERPTMKVINMQLAFCTTALRSMKAPMLEGPVEKRILPPLPTKKLKNLYTKKKHAE